MIGQLIVDKCDIKTDLMYHSMYSEEYFSEEVIIVKKLEI